MAFTFFKSKLENKQEDKLVETDLGFFEDTLSAIIELLHIELHSFRSFIQTKNKDWLSINNQARIERSELLELICNKDELKNDGESWCYFKHSLRLVGSYMELFNRELTKGNKEKAEYYADKAGAWLGIFLIKNNIKGGKDV